MIVSGIKLPSIERSKKIGGGLCEVGGIDEHPFADVNIDAFNGNLESVTLHTVV